MSKAGITVAIKGEINDLEQKIVKSRELITEAVSQIANNNKKLDDAQKSVIKSQSEYSEEIKKTKDEINKLLKIKARNNALDSEQKKELQGLNSQLKVYKNKQKEIVDEEKNKLAAVLQTVQATNSLISTNEKVISTIKQEISVKQKIIDLENQRTESLRAAAIAGRNKLDAEEKDIISQRAKLVLYTNTEKLILGYTEKTAALARGLKTKIITTDEYRKSLKLLNEEIAKSTGVESLAYSNKAISGSTISKAVGIDKTNQDELNSTKALTVAQQEYNERLDRKAKGAKAYQEQLAKQIAEENNYTKAKYNTVSSLLAQRRAEEKNIEQLKETFDRTYKNTQAQNSYNDAVKHLNTLKTAGIISGNDFNSALKKEKDALVQADIAAQNKEKSTSNLANTTIRYLRWAGTIAGVVYAGKRAWDLTAGSGIAVNKIIENNTYGIAALISANTQMVDSLGKTISPIEKFTKGQEHAKKIIAELRTESTKTAATFPQLLEIFQQGIGKTLSMGDAFGATTEEIEKNTIKLASRMSNFANAIGMPMDRVKEEMRSLVSGNASTDSLISTIIFGSPGEANKAIKEAENKVNGVADLLNKKFTPFDILAETKTFDKSVLAVQDSWSRAMGDMVEKSGAFKDITNIFYDMSKDITGNTEDIVKAFDGMYNGVKTIFTALNTDAAAYIAALAGVVATLNIIARLNPYVAGATIVGGAVVASQTGKQKELDNETQSKIDEVNKLVSESKTQETDKALIETLETRIKALHTMYAGQQMTEEFATSLNKQQSVMREHITNLEKRRDITNEEREVVAKITTDQKQVADLVANIKIDTDRIKEDEKEILKTKGNTAEWEAEITKYKKTQEESILKLKKAEEAQSQAVKQSGKENLIIAADIATLKKDIANQDLLIGLKQSKIAEENQKDADISFKKAETLLNKKKEQNKQDSENKAVLLELSMLQSGQIDEERLKISLSQLAIETKQEEAKYLQEGLDKNKLLVEIEKEKLNLKKLQNDEEEKKQKQYKFDKISGVVKYADMENLGQIYQELSVYYKEDPESLADLETWVEREQNKLSKKPLVIDIKLQGWDEVSNSIATFGNGFQDINKAQKKYQQENKKVIKDEVALNQARVDLRDTTMSGIADMTGAVASFYDEDDDRRKKQLELQKVFSAAKMAMQIAEMTQSTAFTSLFVAQEAAKGATAGATAVAVAAQSSPWTGFATAAAMAALLASFGIMIGGKTKTSTTSDAFSAQKANTGTGSVLGDSTKASESITEALEILKDFARPEYQTLQSMNNYLKNIASSIGGVASLLVQNSPTALGTNYTGGFNTGFKNNIGLSSGSLSNFGIVDALISGSPAGLITNVLSKMKIPIISDISNMFGNIINSVMGGLFGKTKVSQALTDSGITFAKAYLKDAVNQLNGSAYQTISTTVSKKSYFSSSSSTFVNTYFSKLNQEVSSQFSLVLSNLYNTVEQAGSALRLSSSNLNSSLDNFVVSIGKISLKGKTGTQIQTQLTNIFSKISDDLAKATIPGIASFQQVGEGLFNTLTRVTSGIKESEYYISKLGQTFSNISYSDIINKQGDIGFEALLQSITKADEASNGLNNNLVQIIKSLDSTAEELYITYISLDTVRESFKFLKIGADALSFSTIKGAGGVEALSLGVSAYIENFMTDEEKLTYSTALLQKEFTKLNIAMPTSKQAFKDLLASIDKTTPAGQELYGRLIILSEGFAKVSDEAENLFNDSISRITDIQNAFLDLIGIIDTTINNLLGKQTGNTTTEATITNYLQKREQVDVLLGKGSTLTETELSNLNSLVSELASMASTIQSGFEDNTAITGNLVQDLALVKSKINYSNQFVQNDLTKAKATTLATGFSEGGYTGIGGKYEIAGAVHKNEYVINSESLNAIGGVDAVKSMVQREIIQKNTNTSNTSIEYSNDKGGIIEELKKGQETLAMGFNAMLKKLEDIIDYNDERREQSHSVTVTGSVIIEG